MVCCLLIEALIGALLSLPRRLFGLRAPTSVAWRPGDASAFRNPSRAASIRNALRGGRDLIAGEINFRFHLVAAVCVTGAGLWLQLRSDDWRWLVVAITLVLLTEALNTGIERACDAVTTMRHPMIRMAKDIASTAVLIAVLAAMLIGALTFAPYLGALCGG
jgi:diacylglycerol kinase (ATP)